MTALPERTVEAAARSRAGVERDLVRSILTAAMNPILGADRLVVAGTDVESVDFSKLRGWRLFWDRYDDDLQVGCSPGRVQMLLTERSRDESVYSSHSSYFEFSPNGARALAVSMLVLGKEGNQDRAEHVDLRGNTLEVLLRFGCLHMEAKDANRSQLSFEVTVADISDSLWSLARAAEEVGDDA